MSTARIQGHGGCESRGWAGNTSVVEMSSAVLSMDQSGTTPEEGCRKQAPSSPAESVISGRRTCLAGTQQVNPGCLDPAGQLALVLWATWLLWNRKPYCFWTEKGKVIKAPGLTDSRVCDGVESGTERNRTVLRTSDTAIFRLHANIPHYLPQFPQIPGPPCADLGQIYRSV